MLSIKKTGSGPWNKAGYMFCACMLFIFQAAASADVSRSCAASGFIIQDVISVDNARALVLTENFDNAVSVYAQLLYKDSTNVSLNSEFAYALALEGIYDASLIRLDKIWNSGAGNSDAAYFASQILALMGYDKLSAEFGKTSGQSYAPEWVSSKAPVLLQKYGRNKPGTEKMSHDELVNGFKRANRLTAQNFTIQSVALFEEITQQYPGEYLPYVGYSIALERAGMPEKSAQAIETALVLIGDDPLKQETKQILDKRLALVKQKISASVPGSRSASATPVKTEGASPNMMAYAGGYLSSSYSSLSVRFGQFFTRNDYATVDLGMTNSSGSTYANVGFTIFNRQKIFVLGLGLTGSFGGGNSLFYSKLSVGPSFMNKKGTASFDIFLDGKVPLKKGYATMMGISVGRSIYFGKRK